jgi:hypothetical protein
MNINGMMTYTSGNDNKLVEVKQMDVPLEVLSQAEKRNLLLTGEAPGSAEQTAQVSQETVTQQTVTQPDEDVTRQEQRTEPDVTRPVAVAGGSSVMDTPVLEAENGVYFRVQVAATAEATDARAFFREAGVDRDVFVERQGGFYKYTVGSFRSYGDAVTYRDRVENLPDVEGSFVVAYRDGVRVPVSSVRQ